MFTAGSQVTHRSAHKNELDGALKPWVAIRRSGTSRHGAHTSETGTMPRARQRPSSATAPVTKEALALADAAAQSAVEEVGQMKQHVLTSFMGELHDDLRR